MDRTIFEHWRPESQRMTEIVMDSETGLPLIVHTQNVRPIIEANKRASSNYDRHARNPHGWTRVASIPAVIWRQLQRTGVASDSAALDAWLDQRDNAAFRVDGRRRLS